jgi:hypothetical protein
VLVETRSRTNRRALESTDPAWMLALRAQVLVEVPVEAWHTFGRPKSFVRSGKPRATQA